jgi:hypothetical protein
MCRAWSLETAMLKAIETKYKGYRFRSRLEARWAVFFDALDIQWEYEKEGYELNVGWYLPDFWLPQVNMWAEVKPETFSELELLKIEDLARETEKPCLMLIGTPENKPYQAINWAVTDGGWPGECEGVSDGFMLSEYLLTMYKAYPVYEGRFYAFPAVYERFEDTARAVEAARSARFEHGKQL